MPDRYDNWSYSGPVCPHHDSTNRAGLAVIAIGNTLRADDGIGKLLSEKLPEPLSDQVCRFNIESTTQLVTNCLHCHKAAIIIDAMFSGGKPGESTVIDLHAVVRQTKAGVVNSCHGLSIIDELRIASLTSNLPDRLVFFGIEAECADWGAGISESVKERFPELVLELGKVTQDLLDEAASHA
jgi:hydrogenase maturation protease